MDQLDSKNSPHLFPEKFCGHGLLENGKAITRIVKILTYFKLYLNGMKKLPLNDDRFPFLKSMVNSITMALILEFSLIVTYDLEPFLNYYFYLSFKT